MNWTAENICTLRKRLGLTQEAMAREMGLSVDTVRRWEQQRGKPSYLAREALERLEKSRR